MTELRPGTSPPPVRMPIRFFTIAPLNLDFRGFAAIRKVLCFTQHLPSSEARLPICTILMPLGARAPNDVAPIPADYSPPIRYPEYALAGQTHPPPPMNQLALDRDTTAQALMIAASNLKRPPGDLPSGPIMQRPICSGGLLTPSPPAEKETDLHERSPSIIGGGEGALRLR